MSGPVVSNTSPLISLERIGRLDLLRTLSGEVLIPPAVAEELGTRITFPTWIVERMNSKPQEFSASRASLGCGETEAIHLALEVSARLLLPDDGPARRIAQAARLPIAGTLGVLIEARKLGLLNSIKADLDALIAGGFRVSEELYETVLLEADER